MGCPLRGVENRHPANVERGPMRGRSRSSCSRNEYDRRIVNADPRAESMRRRSVSACERAIQISVAEIAFRHLELLNARLAAWVTLWDTPLLAKSISLRTSTRLRRALGTYSPAHSQITLAHWLLDDAPHRDPHPLLDEVLCHEAAHAAVHLTRLRRTRPHGKEWRGFMLAAGFEPRVRIPEGLMPEGVRAAMAAGKRWEHRCLRCQAVRMARVRVTRWRCRRCVESGGSGRLGVRRVEFGLSGRAGASLA